MSFRQSGSQTVGPFFSIGLEGAYRAELEHGGDACIEVRGTVLDGGGEPVADAVLEIWHADARGHYAHPEDPEPSDVRAFLRVPTDSDGGFRFRTVKPGACGAQAPHLLVNVLMRGLLKQATTRLYFPDDPAHASDPVLAQVPQARRATLIGKPAREGILQWDIHMQGDDETVFFEY